MGLLTGFEDLIGAVDNEAKALGTGVVNDVEQFFGGLEPELKADAAQAWTIVKTCFTNAAGQFLPTLYSAVKSLVTAALGAAAGAAASGGNPVATVVAAIEAEAPSVMQVVSKAALTTMTGAIASGMPQLTAVAQTAVQQVEQAAAAAVAPAPAASAATKS